MNVTEVDHYPEGACDVSEPKPTPIPVNDLDLMVSELLNGLAADRNAPLKANTMFPEEADSHYAQAAKLILSSLRRAQEPIAPLQVALAACLDLLGKLNKPAYLISTAAAVEMMGTEALELVRQSIPRSGF